MDYWYGWGSGMTTIVSIESTGETVDDKNIVEYAEKFLASKLDEKKSINIVGDNNVITVWGIQS